MDDKKKKMQIAGRILAATGALLVLTLLGGVWLLPLLAIFGTFAAVVRLLFLHTRKAKQVETVKPMQTQPETIRQPTEEDVRRLAYAVILNRITVLVRSEYPDARWVWESPDAQKRIEAGEEVFILLNRAGGYRRAGVTLKNLRVEGLVYNPPEDAAPNAEAEPGAEPSEPEPLNYELLAFEWADAHILDLNARCNEAIGQNLTELVLLTEELPVRESWPDVCRELTRAGLEHAKCVPEGIKIDLTQ